MSNNLKISTYIKFGFVACLVLASTVLSAQKFTQTIQGKVYDNFTGSLLPGVNVVVINDSIQKGTATDVNGEFIFTDLPIGKYVLKASYIGYKGYEADNLYLPSGRAINIDIRLNESAKTLKEVSVNAVERKNEPLNNMALIGARSFTLDETNRYAGAYGDPARMAMNYAGVLPVRDNRNDIIVRGNSATGLLWRIEDIEIPNPNHFGATGTTGGPITIINTNLLSKSDFFNGAFPAEYGDALAGVFDLKLKSSNMQKHEKWIQIGWNGLELGLEGPLKKGKKASYLVSYRHGLPHLIYLMGYDPKRWIEYKDFSFKLNFPGTKTGNWSIIGMGGNSQIIIDDMKLDEDERTFETYGEKLDNSTAMGVFGITNRVYPSKRAKIVNTLAVTGNVVKNLIDTFTIADQNYFKWGIEDTEEIKFSANTTINYKLGTGSNLTAGVVYNHYLLSFNDIQHIDGAYQVFSDTSQAQLNLMRLFIGYKRMLGARFQGYIGLHSQMFFYNNSNAMEPRLGLKFMLNEKSDISYGFGLHSQVQPKVVYFIQTENDLGQKKFTNSDLDFTKSIHNTLGYNYLINKNLRLKVEAYYQHLYNIPIHNDLPEYSLINFGTEYYVDRQDSLVNKGTGQNYGVEITFERFLDRNFFYLFTASLFESNYTSIDNITRSTAYNGQFAFNALAGYELYFPKKGAGIILGVNLTYAGGSPYVPYDQESTVRQSKVVYDWSNAYNVRREDYKRASIRLGIRRNMKKSSIETTIDFQYRSEYTSIYQDRIDVTTGEIINTSKMGFYPMINSRISF